jgi:hypothetical protein
VQIVNHWIFFRATRTDGLPPKEGKVIIFPCFDAVLNDFSTFYELLPFDSVLQKLHFARLNTVEGLLSRPREQRYFVLPPDEARLLPRTELGRDVADIFNRFFAGISSEQDEEMRRGCFVETRESREADATLTKIASHLTNTINGGLQSIHTGPSQSCTQTTRLRRFQTLPPSPPEPGVRHQKEHSAHSGDEERPISREQPATSVARRGSFFRQTRRADTREIDRFPSVADRRV